jgi:hypothetical protein
MSDSFHESFEENSLFRNKSKRACAKKEKRTENIITGIDKPWDK